ncbi:putative ribonuclease H-like domain-containing protein [Tanacetum coccineum]
MTHPHPKGNFVPKAVLMKSGIKTLNTAGQNFSKAAVSVNTARPIYIAYPRPIVNSAKTASNVFNRAHTHVRRPFNKSTTNKNSNLKEKVNTVKGDVTTAGPKAVVTDNNGNEANTVKASAYYEEIDGGFVAFGGDPKGGKIIGKGKISTDTECVVLSPDFKLLDENHVLLRVPRKDNMYSVDLKNIVPSGGIENLIDLKVKVIRCDNGTEFKNKVMNQFCEMMGIKREFSVARTPQQNGVAERKNRTLMDAARTMLADSKLPTTFWAEAVNTACYVQNRVLVIKPHNKTPYELFLGRKPALSFMRPFGCPVTILNTLDHLGKFDGKADEGFFVGYSTNSKAYRVFNGRTRIVEENLHVKFSKETPNIAGNGPNWLFDIDALTISMNYKPVVAGNQTNGNAGIKENIDAGQARKKIVPDQEYILLPLLTSDPSLSKSSKDSPDAGFKPSREEENIDTEHQENEDSEVLNTQEPRVNHEQDANVNSTNNINTVNLTVSAADIENNVVDENIVYGCIDDPNMPNLEEIFYSDDDDEVGAEADMNNLATNVPVSPIPTTRVHKDHPLEQIIGDINSAPQTRRMTKNVTEHVEPKKVIQALTDPSWIEAMQDELLQFKLQKMDVKSAFLYGTIEEEVYVCQPLGFEDPQFPDKVYKVYVDDIIFGSTKKSLCFEFEQMMHKRFQISSMGELTFFLGLQVKQKDDGIFISHDKYVTDILNKFNFVTVKTTSTPIETNKALLKDEEVEDVDVHLYRSMIGSLMYLTTSRPGIMFVVYACARDSPFYLEAFSDSDYVGASLDRKSTTRDETVIKEWEDRMEMAATTASSLEAEQDSGNINRTQSMATLNESVPQGTDSGSGFRCQDTILGGAKAQIRFEAASKQSNDPPLLRVNTLRSGEDSMKLMELMEFCTKLSVRDFDL